ncbi:hypothetical protein FOA52_003784 [Chlamydomonas sp. UWO 241]|nr:hypothetical protein FOA52_003784 [Chlamydomonas sp. UWO 241]
MSDPVEQAKAALCGAKKQFDAGLKATVQFVGDGVAGINLMMKEGSSQASVALGTGKAHAEQALEQYKTYEDQAFSALTDGIHWASANPFIAYSAAGTATVLLLPFTRRLLYRATLGRLRNEASVVASCDARAKGIASRMDEYSAEVTKLQEKMVAAEAEYRGGMAKLRSTRQQMQRLSLSLGAGERSASGMVKELRSLSPRVDNVLQLRGEAAGHAYTLRSHKAKVDKFVRRIANMDI